MQFFTSLFEKAVAPLAVVPGADAAPDSETQYMFH